MIAVPYDTHTLRLMTLMAFLDRFSEHVLSSFQGFFLDIFNLSPASATVPTSFKSTSKVQVTKHLSPTCLNKPSVALTPRVMKCFKRLVLAHKNACRPHWILTNLHTKAIGVQRMLYPQYNTVYFHTWTTKTHACATHACKNAVYRL